MLGKMLAAAAFAVSVSPAVHAADKCPVQGGTVRIAFSIDPGDLTPGKVAQWPPSLIFDQIYDTLLKVGPNGPEPSLAESYEVAEDNLSVTLKLRQNVMFHHGRELEAQDVVYSLSRLSDPAFSSPWAGMVSVIQDVVAVDDMTVRIDLKEPFAPILNILSTAWYTAIVPYDFAPENNANSKASGTGPFVFEEYVPNDHVTLKANDSYWEEGYPCVDGIQYDIIPEQQAQISAFRQRRVDIVALDDPKFISLLKGDSEAQLLEPADPVQESGMAVNNREGATADIRVRQALSLGMDRRAIIDTVLFGFGQIGTKIPCGEAPYGWCEDKDAPLPNYEYDPEKAKALLEEAGYGDGLDLSMQVSLPLDVQTAEILAEQWKEIGVNLSIQQIPDVNQQLDSYLNGKFETSIITLVWQPDPHTNVYPIFLSTSNINLGKFADADIDKLLEAGKRELDVEKRIEIYDEVQRIVAEKAYMLFPFTKPVNWQYTNKRLKNYEPTPSGSFSQLRYSWIEAQ